MVVVGVGDDERCDVVGHYQMPGYTTEYLFTFAELQQCGVSAGSIDRLSMMLATATSQYFFHNGALTISLANVN